MFNLIFEAINDEHPLCKRVGHTPALVFAGLVYRADATGVTRGLQLEMRYSLGMSDKAWDKAIAALVAAKIVEEFYELTPIAEFGNGRVVMGRIQCFRIVHFKPPEIHKRLSESAWAAIRKSVFERDDYTCAYCGCRGGELECDHVVPISIGGTNEEGNLVTACRSCNRRKRDKVLSEWKRTNLGDDDGARTTH